ncbi:MAG: hypothetical protein ACOX1I_01770 [Dethiobacteria bacterium]|jgi:hypothetical protein
MKIAGSDMVEMQELEGISANKKEGDKKAAFDMKFTKKSSIKG